jgi:hypothetical protein
VTVAIDAATESVRTGTGSPHTFSHAGASSGVRGFLLAVVYGSATAGPPDHVTAVSYGGVACRRVQRNTDTATELGAAEWWVLERLVPQGTQTVSATCGSTTDDIQFTSITLLGDGDIAVVDADGVNNDTANPSVTLQYLGNTCLAFGALYGGGAAPTSFTPNGNCETISDHDFGNFYAEVIRQTTPGSSDFAIGGTASSDDVAFAAIAVCDTKVRFIGSGAVATGTTSITPAYPTGIAADDKLLLYVVNKYPTNGPSTPAGWALVAQVSGGSGSPGAGTGNVYVTVFEKDASGSESGSLSVTITSGNSSAGAIVAWRSSTGAFSVAATTASDNTRDTSLSFTGAADPGIAALDHVLMIVGLHRQDPGLSGHALSATGVTFAFAAAALSSTFLGTAVADGDGCYVTTNTRGNTAARTPAIAIAGPSSAAPVFTATCAGGGEAAGACVFVRLRAAVSYAMTAAQGSYTLSGQVAALTHGYPMAADQGSYTLAGQVVGLRTSRRATVDSGNYTLTGQATTLEQGRRVAVEQGSYTLAGQAVTLKRGRYLEANHGVYNLTGQAVNLLGGRRLAADQGAYALAGQIVGLLSGRRLLVEQGAYALAGQNVTLTYTPAGDATLSVETGSFALSGQQAALLTARLLMASQGPFTVAGQAATLLATRRFSAELGTFALAGQNALLQFSRRLVLDNGAYAVSGNPVDMDVTRHLVAVGGIYQLTGVDVSLRASGESFLMVAEAGIILVTGYPASLQFRVVPWQDIVRVFEDGHIEPVT